MKKLKNLLYLAPLLIAGCSGEDVLADTLYRLLIDLLTGAVPVPGV